MGQLGGTAGIRSDGMVVNGGGHVYMTGFIRNGNADLDPGPDEFIFETPLTSCSVAGYVNFDFYIIHLNPDGELVCNLR